MKELVLLKENEEGHGLIVEWNTRSGCSGYISQDLQDSEILKEYEDLGKKKGTLFMNCILQKSDTQNKNGRFYPKELLVSEDKKYQELIREGRALGASDHPDITFISLKKDEVSHRVVKTWWEGNTLMGVLEILTSRGYAEYGVASCQGDFIALLLEKGVKIGISSRGIGSLRNVNGRNTVQNDFELICYDLVSTPSTSGAFLYPKENVKINENNLVSNPVIINELNNKLNLFLKK